MQDNKKKKEKRYLEANQEEQATFVEEISQIPVEKVAYIDETGVEEQLSSEYCYSRSGKKIYNKVSGKRVKRTNVVAAKQGDKKIGVFQYYSIGQ